VQSTAAVLRVTVNLGVFSPALDRALGGSVGEPSEPACHWRERLGFLLPAHADVWWTVSDAAEAAAVAAEISDAIAAVGLSALGQVGSTQALRALWERDVCPGLTEYQRRRYLAALAAVGESGGAPVT
jgi:Domain of unknown function (DUF4304)